MSTAKHSPLPWEIDRNAKLSDSDGEFVAFLASAVCRNPDGHTDEQGEANAALIVKSVNLHDELVAMLDEVLKLSHDNRQWDFNRPSLSEWQDQFDNVRDDASELLARARQ